MVLHVLIARDESARPVTYDQRCVQSKSAKERERERERESQGKRKRKKEGRKETRNGESRLIGSRRGNPRESKKWARTTQLEEGQTLFVRFYVHVSQTFFKTVFYIYSI